MKVKLSFRGKIVFKYTVPNGTCFPRTGELVAEPAGLIWEVRQVIHNCDLDGVLEEITLFVEEII